MLLFTLLIACVKEQPTTYQMLPQWVRSPAKGCAVGSARYRSDLGGINKEKATKLATERAMLGLTQWVGNSCQLYLRDTQKLCSPCIKTNDASLELKKETFKAKLLSNPTVSNQIEQEDFIHISLCIEPSHIQTISNEAGYAGETLDPDIEYCMSKMTANLERSRQEPPTEN